MPANSPEDRRTVRRCSLGGFAGGVLFALLIVPMEFNYLCRRADGTIGTRTNGMFVVVVKGPDGDSALAPAPPERDLYCHEKLAYALPSSVPYLLFCTLIGYAVGRGRVRARAARLQPLTPEQLDYDDSINANRPPVST